MLALAESSDDPTRYVISVFPNRPNVTVPEYYGFGPARLKRDLELLGLSEDGIGATVRQLAKSKRIQLINWQLSDEVAEFFGWIDPEV